MKEIWKKKKIFVITIALMVGIIGTAATFAIITATAGTVTNTFQAAKVATEIEEEFEGGIRAGSTVKKNPSVKNTGISDAFVRVRITISPEQTEVTLLNGTWNGTAFRRKARQRTALRPRVRCMILTVTEPAGIRARTAGFTTTVRLHRGRTRIIYLMQ